MPAEKTGERKPNIVLFGVGSLRADTVLGLAWTAVWGRGALATPVCFAPQPVSCMQGPPQPLFISLNARF
jgi:hypothetical protein